jgi:formylglycine-generating enzyme required for sulfatase activity
MISRRIFAAVLLPSPLRTCCLFGLLLLLPLIVHTRESASFAPPVILFGKAKDDLKPGMIYTNKLGMKFAWIPPGTFTMGSPNTEEGRQKWEVQHKVTLTRGFYMGVYPVTQKQWHEVMGGNPSNFKKGDNYPVEMVSWEDCQKFVKKLSEREGQEYRLPTEAEWEYACRAGTTTTYYTGDDENALDRAGWYSKNSGKVTHPVGQKEANKWGLYDMHGNVYQWCADWYGDYPQGDDKDPKG